MHRLLLVHDGDRLGNELCIGLLRLSCLHSLLLCLHLLRLYYVGICSVMWAREALAFVTDECWLLRWHLLDHHRLLWRLLSLVLYDNCILEAHVDRLVHGLLHHLLLLLFHSTQILSTNFPISSFIHLTFMNALVVHEHVRGLGDLAAAHSLRTVVL